MAEQLHPAAPFLPKREQRRIPKSDRRTYGDNTVGDSSGGEQQPDIGGYPGGPSGPPFGGG
jgi:hypothetical protein